MKTFLIPGLKKLVSLVYVDETATLNENENQSMIQSRVPLEIG